MFPLNAPSLLPKRRCLAASLEITKLAGSTHLQSRQPPPAAPSLSTFTRQFPSTHQTNMQTHLPECKHPLLAPALDDLFVSSEKVNA